MTMKTIMRNLVLPPKFYNSYWLNRLGIQPLRIILDRFFWYLRPMRVSPEFRSTLSALEQNGYVVIENFLPQEDFQRLREEFKASFNPDNADIRNRVSGKNLIEEIDVLESNQQSYALSRRLFLMSETIRKIVQWAAHKKIRLPMACIMQRLSIESYKDKKNVILHQSEDFDAETILHQDASLPIYKAWLYLDDVGTEDGAFVYAPKSNRLTFERLKYEYRRSCQLMKMQMGRTDELPKENLYLGRYVPSPADRKALGIEEKSMTGKANTLVIANTLGFHRRGNIEPGRIRSVLHLDFKRLQSGLNLIPFAGKIPHLEKLILQNRRPEKVLQY
ncbi:MAG: phytanoyl-CoA dioxygenase family protein [Bdellovibrionales bacterium]|nr:phytanoyl-CoA dioxygenase family protein [Bdellovibrionales bacterium]